MQLLCSGDEPSKSLWQPLPHFLQWFKAKESNVFEWAPPQLSTVSLMFRPCCQVVGSECSKYGFVVFDQMFCFICWQQFWFPARYSFWCHLKVFVHCNWLSNLLTVDWTWSPSSLLNIKWPFLPNPNFLKYCIEAKHREDLSSPCSNQSIPGSA